MIQVVQQPFFLPETGADVEEAAWFIQNNKLKVTFVGVMVVQC